MSGEKKRIEDVNWNIEEVVLSQDGKSIQSISGDTVLTRNKLRSFIDKEKLSGRSGARSKEAMIQLIMSHSSIIFEMYFPTVIICQTETISHSPIIIHVCIRSAFSVWKAKMFAAVFSL